MARIIFAAIHYPKMDTLTLARVLHVLAVVLWIGGVAMVTLVIIPAIKKLKSKEERLHTFEKIEGRFALQAKIWTLLAGITGFYMLYVLDGWQCYLYLEYWWIHAMTLVWLLFTVMLFFLEPFVLHRLFRKKAMQNPQKTFRVLNRLHWVLLFLSLLTIAGAVAGSHGWFWVR